MTHGEVNRFVQEPDKGECPKYEYRQYETPHGLITIGVNLCEEQKTRLDTIFEERLLQALQDLEEARDRKNETTTIINEDGEELTI